jgi:hypothetical protein
LVSRQTVILAARSERERTYAPLAAIANRWMEALGDNTRFPASLAQLTAQCQATPLLPAL